MNQKFGFKSLMTSICTGLMVGVFSTAVAAQCEMVIPACNAVQLSLYGGVSRLGLNTGHLAFASDETDTLKNRQDHNKFIPGIGIAYNFFLPANLTNSIIQSISIGLDYYYFKNHQNGDVYLYMNPDFNNFKYKIDVKSSNLMLNAEMNFYAFWQGIIPFIEGGIGVARNSVEYRDRPNPGVVGQGSGLNLPNTTKNKFAFDAGAGIKAPITGNLLLSLRYLYSGLGSVHTKTQGNYTIAKPLNVKIHNQSVLLGLNYLII